MIAAGGFHPHWVSTLYLVFLCVIFCSVFYCTCYCLYGSNTQIKYQLTNYKFTRCTLVAINIVAYIHKFH